jgi:hypothetical protein
MEVPLDITKGEAPLSFQGDFLMLCLQVFNRYRLDVLQEIELEDFRVKI